MAIIRLLDARRGLYRKCEELFRDEKIAESIYRFLCDGIEECEDAEPERKKGEWLELTNTNHTYVCSVCGRMLVNITDGKNTVTKNYPFCHCGADMRENGE